jgi:guanylate kinase
MTALPVNTGGQAGGAADRPGRLFIVSAPSGAGKSTLCQRLRRRFKRLRYSISHTTRPPRRGETDGIDYHFTTRREFESGIQEGRWAEWAEVHGNYYGTSGRFIDRCLKDGHGVLLDIDVQGTRKLLVRYPDSVTIFIQPPSMAVLEQRLKARATDSPEAIARRLRNAADEMAQAGIYRHLVVNDDLETALAELIDILASYGVGAGE